MRFFTQIFLAALLTVACGGSESTSSCDPRADANCDGEPVTGPGCDLEQLPVVAVHGFLGSGDNYAQHAMRFKANGLCDGYFGAFDWNSLAPGEDHSEALDTFIDALLAKTGHSQVNLMGHSAGGGVSYAFLEDETRAAKVAHYAHIGSFVNSSPAGPGGEVPTLNLWSDSDFVITEKGDIDGATNINLVTDDHMSVVSSDASFSAIYTFFNDTEPKTLEIVSKLPLYESGRVVSLGENIPQEGTVYRHVIDAKTGVRVGDGQTIEIGEGGHWGPTALEAETYYEYELNANDAERPVHFYRPPAIGSDHLNYLRTFPKTGTGAIINSLINYDDKSAVLVIFCSTRGLIVGQDSLKVNGREIVTEASAFKENTSLAFFLYDRDGDQESTGEVLELMGGLPFLVLMDIFLDVTASEPVQIELNGQKLAIPALKSQSEGPSVVVFSP